MWRKLSSRALFWKNVVINLNKKILERLEPICLLSSWKLWLQTWCSAIIPSRRWIQSGFNKFNIKDHCLQAGVKILSSHNMCCYNNMVQNTIIICCIISIKCIRILSVRWLRSSSIITIVVFSSIIAALKSDSTHFFWYLILSNVLSWPYSWLTIDKTI